MESEETIDAAFTDFLQIKHSLPVCVPPLCWLQSNIVSCFDGCWNTSSDVQLDAAAQVHPPASSPAAFWILYSLLTAQKKGLCIRNTTYSRCAIHLSIQFSASHHCIDHNIKLPLNEKLFTTNVNQYIFHSIWHFQFHLKASWNDLISNVEYFSPVDCISELLHFLSVENYNEQQCLLKACCSN